jgi:hypothetical protein
MYLKERGYEDMDWNHLAEERAQWRGSFESVEELLGFIKDKIFLD